MDTHDYILKKIREAAKGLVLKPPVLDNIAVAEKTDADRFMKLMRAGAIRNSPVIVSNSLFLDLREKRGVIDKSLDLVPKNGLVLKMKACGVDVVPEDPEKIYADYSAAISLFGEVTDHGDGKETQR